MDQNYYTLLPKFIQVKKSLADKISEGIFKPGEKLPAQPRLAKELKVTKATLTKAILELVNEGLLDTKTGQGTYIAQKQKTLQDFTVYALINDFKNPYQAKFANLLNQLAVSHRFDAKILITGFSPEEETAQLKTLLKNPESYIFSIGISSDKIRKIIKADGHRFFVFGPAPELKGYTNVITTDYPKGTMKITNLLFEKGHRRIAYIGKIVTSSYSRYYGFEQAYKKRRIKLDEKLIISDGQFLTKIDTEKDKIIEKVCIRLLKLNPPATAVLCHNDQIAIHLIINLLQMGISIPAQLSFCSFDGALDGLIGPLRITSVLQPLELMMQKAISQIINHRTSDRIYEIYEPEIISGNTVKSLI